MSRYLANGRPFVSTNMPDKQLSHTYANGIISPLSPPATRNASPTPARQARPHARATYEAWRKLKNLLEGEQIVLDGESLDIPSVVAVAKYGRNAKLDTSGKVRSRIDESIAMLQEKLATGELIYGVNTGFGGSADTRTNDLRALQHALVQHQNSGILSDIPCSEFSSAIPGTGTSNSSTMMPRTWARGLMLARLNSIIRGHSAVSLPVIDLIFKMIERDITPVIPVRGSISASGDLIPLSYVAGALMGNPDIYCLVKTKKERQSSDSIASNVNSSTNARRDDHEEMIISSDKALKLHDLTPIDLGAKEGLGLLNGTAASVAVASLVLHEANNLAVLGQILTAMGCEALHGTAESFHPFIAAVRPHRGQVEAAANVLGFLSGSRLAMGLDSGLPGAKEKDGLAQDRYALRTSTQWIGPQLEDLMLATDQVGVELNSTTDNPLIDTTSGLVHHGGNFQAASLTSAMEKVRLTLQMLGKMLFAQCTEIMNPAMNRGLSPNLCVDDPSLSFWGKGIDIAMAAYCSEMAFLSNPVSTHVQSAEMHNQALNSLALISARYTMNVVEIGNMMVASCLVMLCQALDLRVLQMVFKEKVKPKVSEMMDKLLERYLESKKIEGSERGVEAEAEAEAETETGSKGDNRQMIIGDKVWDDISQAWDETTNLDLHQRCEVIAERAGNTLMTALTMATEVKGTAHELFTTIRTWKQYLSYVLEATYDATRRDMFDRHRNVTPPYLGQASRKLYSFVRGELAVPFHRGLVEDPTLARQDPSASPSSVGGKTIGSLISRVYDALRDGRLIEPVMAAVGENFDCKDNTQAARGD